MILSLKRQDLYIGLGKESYENENYWLNDGDRDFGTICLAFSPSLLYLIDSAEYPKDISPNRMGRETSLLWAIQPGRKKLNLY